MTGGVRGPKQVQRRAVRLARYLQSDTVGRALLPPFVAGAVGTFLAWWVIEGAPSGGDTWGLRLLWEIPLVSGVVGLIVGAIGRRPVGFLSGLIGFCVGVLAAEVAWHGSGNIVGLSLLLGGVPFTVAYAIGAVLVTPRTGAGDGGA